MASSLEFQSGPIPATRVGSLVAAYEQQGGIGAHAIFLGRIRGDAKAGGRVRAIQFSTYKEMAYKEFESIAKDLSARYEIQDLTVIHSEGEVAVGQLCMVIFVAGARRDATLSAERELVERVKFDLPIWGKEVLEDGGDVWKVNT
ncbi:molybdopterinconverting factor subunit [Nitritalea halalkaliphila LW7]|uniref:Molybdopterin synthase catalytic subunit n=1 Tax=Nitritalea halalkaliphila LW7 TaxID=1189621 RepID=I5C7M4_9BACT|nr:molybdenum cofactor biosynthesis protein MoaE [Nitritalea halalkaliphila]EIM77826.1 molybdopterinconverting factor subunit [Nitritalea halalkaliphila LW7]